VQVREIAAGLRFPEGPISMADGSIVLVEIARGTLSRVHPDGRVDVVAETGGGPNGAAVGPDGRVWVCNNGGFEWLDAGGLLVPGHQPADYTGGSIQAVDLATGAVETVYTECDGRPLRGPNDLVFDASGGFWFTDHGKARPRERDRTGVFYAAADGSKISEVVFPLEAPNGIALSPDGSRLYVAETPTGRVYGFDVAGPGAIARSPLGINGGVPLYGAPPPRMFDSMAVDGAGHVCVATLVHGGITVIDPNDGSAELVETGDPLTTNICFGGEDLRTAFITLSGTGRLVSVEWPRPGLALAYSA
jgi:gluconolactonase